MSPAQIYATPDLIMLLGIAMLAALVASNMIANTRRRVAVNENLRNKDDQLEQLKLELQQVHETCVSLKKEVDLRDLYNGETDRYLQAINAARSGQDQAYLQREYELNESEAELIISIHGPEETVID